MEGRKVEKMLQVITFEDFAAKGSGEIGQLEGEMGSKVVFFCKIEEMSTCS